MTFLTSLKTSRLIIATLKNTNLTSKTFVKHVSQDSKEDSTVKTFLKHVPQESINDPNIPKYDMNNPFEKEKTKCILCRLNITPDYKNVKLLSQFQSPYTGRIYGRHITGLCTHKQKQVELEIEKAQSACLMGYYNKDPVFMKDPRLFDSENPIRPHRF